jgi:hypothetical protein
MERWEPRPTPEVTPESGPYWEAASEGRLLLGHCPECALTFHHPRAYCPDCLAAADLVEASGRGVVYSYSVAERMEGWPEGDLPLCVGYVELDEGPRMMTTFVDCMAGELSVGTTVGVRFVPTEDEAVAIPVFTPI